MNNQLLLGVLLVTLSWGFMGASAQSSSNTTSNMTASTTTSGPNTTVSLSANTSTVASASSSNSSNATTPSTAGTSNAATSNAAASNATNSNTTASNASASNTTASNSSASNTTASNSTASNTTASNSTTTNTTASATTSFSVATLLTPISRTNCGSTKLCAAEPSSCDPSTGNGCYFISAQQQSGQLYNFEVSGQTDGYIAAGVSTASSQNGTNQAYICVNNNSTVNFFTGTITNLLLTMTQLNASNVKGSVSSNKIQCTFAATLPDTTTRAAAYSLSVSTGTYNSSTGALGSPSFKIFTNQVNLSDPTANVTNQINGAYPVTYQQPLIPALLVTVIMMTFSAL
ncbi:mucin-21 [Nematolebias whitei]|uniref:mucin-21 n=1 Tax=Nematolebias whitei TaxID=451745 RepID=UPI001899C790|nr:mucin-21 [Nematolebias whitei]